MSKVYGTGTFSLTACLGCKPGGSGSSVISTHRLHINSPFQAVADMTWADYVSYPMNAPFLLLSTIGGRFDSGENWSFFHLTLIWGIWPPKLTLSPRKCLADKKVLLHGDSTTHGLLQEALGMWSEVKPHKDAANKSDVCRFNAVSATHDGEEIPRNSWTSEYCNFRGWWVWWNWGERFGAWNLGVAKLFVFVFWEDRDPYKDPYILKGSGLPN